jgi:dihydroneopterin aldolase
VDKIKMNGMQFYGFHGVFPAETELGQRFYVDVELLLPLSKAGVNDHLEDTVNYAEVYYLVKGIIEGKPFKLIEAVAERIASELLQTYTKINEVTVRVTKPHPPFDIHFAGVTVEIMRRRD